jgi:hypothetical protein
MSNARLQITDLDFDQIKTNLKSYLKQQTQFQDYDFEGSGLSVLLDILAYNTHYNAYYLNMVANESFLDTAILRDSVVSHAKTLSYTPYSVTAPRALINVTVNSGTGNTTPGYVTIPRGFSFSSRLMDSVSYNFIVLDDTTVSKSNTTYYFENVSIYEGSLVSYNFNYDAGSNPKSIFTLPDSNIDMSTLQVTVTPNPSNTAFDVYTQATEVLDITATSTAYFIQEGRNGVYQLYFGDDVIGKALVDGSVISVSYLVTNGVNSEKADLFVANATIGGFSAITIDVISTASGGSNRETVDEIKFGATSQFSTQNRLVTVKDYESYIKKNYPSIDSISVWSGEDEIPSVYGKVYIAIKPKLNYFLSDAEKEYIKNDIIAPKSVISISTVIQDPEYLYLILSNNVVYDKTKTTSTEVQLRSSINNAIVNYVNNNLNRFDATFVLSKVQDAIDSVDVNAITGSETSLRLQKRIDPTFNISKSYQVYFNAKLHRGTTSNKLKSSEFYMNDRSNILRAAQIEEILDSSTGVESIDIADAGYDYTTVPTITITGDGTGATAEAKIVNGKIQSITVTNSGINYTRALVTITGDGTGGSATASIAGRMGKLQTIYYNTSAQKIIINSNIGTIDYDTGLIEINDLKIISLVSGTTLNLDIESETGIIKSVRNTIITLDSTDSSAIAVEFSQV